MSQAYLCPNCKTNRSRFHLIKQHPIAVKLDPKSGEIISEYGQNELDPFHLPYQGPETRVQCGSCGLIEDETLFIKKAQSQRSM
ncbi:MAG TPA: DNA alkylation repair protein [Bacilli bacterium]|nr:DNA alkylation repair protein [Bacilli bacterium]